MIPPVCSALLVVSILVACFIVQPAATQTSNDTLPVRYPAKIIPEGYSICPSTEEQEMIFAEIDQDINALIKNVVLPTLACPGTISQIPATSCLEIAECDPSLPTGYYWMDTTTQVYCDMDREASCSDGMTGWTRVAILNMSDPAQQCPSTWREITSPKRTCGRVSGNGCDSVIFSTNGIQYNNVMGRVVGYQFGDTQAFAHSEAADIVDGSYVSGVSITYGSPRGHIWSFAAERVDNSFCPCSTSYTAPSFVGEDYYCESGNAHINFGLAFYHADPLWDGQGCGSNPTCCTYNDPPWFCKKLPQATIDDIEIRLCGVSSPLQYEDTPIELIEIYIL